MPFTTHFTQTLDVEHYQVVRGGTPVVSAMANVSRLGYLTALSQWARKALAYSIAPTRNFTIRPLRAILSWMKAVDRARYRPPEHLAEFKARGVHGGYRKFEEF